jgi:hypothetical protein
VYLPLFAAGKCIGLFLLVCWSVITSFSMSMEASGIFLAEWIMLSGDLLTLAAILLIIKNDNSKLTETQALEEK